jgi:hypothetical protein
LFPHRRPRRSAPSSLPDQVRPSASGWNLSG